MIISLTILLIICLIFGLYLISNKSGIYLKSFKIMLGVLRLEIVNEEKHTKIQKTKKI